MRVLVGVVVAAAVTLGAGASPASAHQSGCHRWHSCPSDTGSYVCGDLGYSCEYGTTPTPAPSPAPAPLPVAPPPAPPADDPAPVVLHLSMGEFRTEAKSLLRDRSGDHLSRFRMNGCVRYSSAKLRCRVFWRYGRSRSALLTIRETEQEYLHKLQVR